MEMLVTISGVTLTVIGLRLYGLSRESTHVLISSLQLCDMCCGLLYLHSKQVVHGDLKAVGDASCEVYIRTKAAILLQSNVLVDDGGRAVLCDFGLSRVRSDVTSRTAIAGIAAPVGSRNWMAPELLNGGRLRKPCDIYAFGMTIYEVRLLIDPFVSDIF